MPKKKSSNSSLKKLSQEEDKPVQQPTKSLPKPGKLGKEIDDIFGGRKKKNKIPEVEESKEKEKPMKKTEMMKKKKKKRKRTDELDGFKNNNSQTRPRKRTADGLQVFTEDELGINNANAGDTPLCPFDCNCCF